MLAVAASNLSGSRRATSLSNFIINGPTTTTSTHVAHLLGASAGNMIIIILMHNIIIIIVVGSARHALCLLTWVSVCAYRICVCVYILRAHSTWCWVYSSVSLYLCMCVCADCASEHCVYQLNICKRFPFIKPDSEKQKSSYNNNNNSNGDNNNKRRRRATTVGGLWVSFSPPSLLCSSPLLPLVGLPSALAVPDDVDLHYAACCTVLRI